ncbi:hypothetical protein AVEN_75826-2 [Araneus ventricosus]|uniref:Uncharacterized protein n=1 Tax=Araneus ventricosus TaxID=182803 RepID=A0A4Y2PPX9_ARAVE|nr:hypothetical protein AVEN_75826-2 [Araneus ventricosus]
MRSCCHSVVSCFSWTANIPPTCYTKCGNPLIDGGTFWSLVYQSVGNRFTWLVSSKGTADSGQLWDSALRGGDVPGSDPLAYRPSG